MKLSKRFKFGITAGAAVCMLGYIPFALYLNVLPWAVSNPQAINFVERTLFLLTFC